MYCDNQFNFFLIKKINNQNLFKKKHDTVVDRPTTCTTLVSFVQHRYCGSKDKIYEVRRWMSDRLISCVCIKNKCKSIS